MVVVVVDRHQPDLITDAPRATDALDLTLVEWDGVEVDELRGVIAVGLFERAVAEVEDIAQRHVFVDDLVLFATEYLAGLRVDVLEIAVLVEQENAQHGGIEDRPVAQGALFFETFLVAVAGHVLLGADDDGGLAVLVAPEHGKHDDVVAQFVVAALGILGPQVQRQVFLVDGFKGILQFREVLGTVSLRELFH